MTGKRADLFGESVFGSRWVRWPVLPPEPPAPPAPTDCSVFLCYGPSPSTGAEPIPAISPVPGAVWYAGRD